MDSPPKSYTILRHTAAILGNIAFEKELYRREIKVTGGVTLLLELLDCPDDKVKEASLGAVMNLTHSKEVCVLMRQLGAIQILTELCTLPNISIQISGLCLGILTNALINDTEEALEVFEVYHVYDRLMDWHEERKEHCTDIEGIIEQVLTTISGLRSGNKIVTDDEKPGLTCAPFPKQSDTTPKTSKVKTASSSLSPSPHHRHNGAGSKHKTSPTYRLLSSELRKSMSAPASQETAIISPPVTAPGSGSTSDVFLFGSIINRYNKNNSCNLFIDICSIESLKRHNIDDRVLRSLCALANDETGGCVYLGVASNGIVHGIPLERAQKDMIRRDIDRSISRVIVPSLDDRYIVSFLPVLRGEEREGEGAANSFVIEINVLASLTNAVHILRGRESKDGGTTDERCFVTRDRQCMKLSLLEVQELVEAREIERYKKKGNIQML
ncbi:PREDICTED: uncharacterized protein LOC109585120 [Amphimedon queenslandica]|uniref:Schlafen AlbA-2 domain-containing protein n=1 Tax=Amphimedon queenslandica TaxID=400682 RepID=A0A1X7U0P8_AMPQE|nr:PREDICTED: uncharacterized protein LOC109585120 [Amphimedon queenslandica]|eukprot:XP_019856633.1 PREDICTED: uncharacterized protein LOC109585120 [Amphimedon queenslandica]